MVNKPELITRLKQITLLCKLVARLYCKHRFSPLLLKGEASPLGQPPWELWAQFALHFFQCRTRDRQPLAIRSQESSRAQPRSRICRNPELLPTPQAGRRSGAAPQPAQAVVSTINNHTASASGFPTKKQSISCEKLRQRVLLLPFLVCSAQPSKLMPNRSLPHTALV